MSESTVVSMFPRAMTVAANKASPLLKEFGKEAMKAGAQCVGAYAAMFIIVGGGYQAFKLGKKTYKACRTRFTTTTDAAPHPQAAPEAAPAQGQYFDAA